MRVLATAGHVDHGKSSLVRALTGMEPDRLEEERRRGLTIDLGFAWCELPSGTEVGIVDVPGHERFVRTMLAGVGPVRCILFVVAADEGWSAQSEEHLAIVDVLGVDGAVVALTKADLVDAERLARAEADVRARLAGTALADAPIVACSSSTGAGIDALSDALDAMLAAAPPAADEGRARLSVDRVFTMRGAGTVVTGTLDGGTLAVGDDVEIAPGGGRARIRGLQSHRRDVDVARPGTRVAVNLAATGRDDLARGDALVAPGTRRATDVVEVLLRPVRGASPPSGRGAFTFHLGSAERTAGLRVLAATDDGAFARIRLAAPVVASEGDRFVLREAGRRATVGGGEVLDADPPSRVCDVAALFARRRGIRGAALAALVVAERGAIAADALALRTGARPDALADAVAVGGWWVSAATREAARAAVTALLARHHRERPLEPGAPIALARDGLASTLRRARVAPDPALVEALVAMLADDGTVARDGAFLRLPEHRAAGSDDPELRRLVARVDGPTPPSIPELVADGVPRAAIDAAVRAGLLVRITPTLVVTTAFVDRAVAAVRAGGAAGITVSGLREALGTTRKYAVPLAEHLDATRVTRREGDLRFARDAGA
ncbi:MAG: selenocysteine-specific translation elongation factor [Actinomycetota bacterium]